MQIIYMVRGGEKHRNNKNRAEKKTAASPKNQEQVRGNQEHDEEKSTNNSETEQGQQESKKDKKMLSHENALRGNSRENVSVRRIEASFRKRNFSESTLASLAVVLGTYTCRHGYWHCGITPGLQVSWHEFCVHGQVCPGVHRSQA